MFIVYVRFKIFHNVMSVVRCTELSKDLLQAIGLGLLVFYDTINKPSYDHSYGRQFSPKLLLAGSDKPGNTNKRAQYG